MNTKLITNKKLKIFLISFAIFAISVIPHLFFTKGTWIYYGDFNVQQIPFYMHVHDAIRQGNFFYDWSTDLGGSLAGCYSFYLLGSPFFWLTIPFPTAWIPYMMPWITALKYAVMALGAYLFAGRYLKTETGAFAAALLFAFSGFNGAVLVYNHFHDFIAFFPFWLILFERMIEDGKRSGFALMTALMLIINYYFFFGGVVFLVIYFVIRYVIFERDYRKTLLRLLRALYTGLTGVLLGCIFFIPGIAYTIGNSRISDTLNGYDLLAYKDSVLWLGIFKNIVMLPDVSGLNSMLNPDMARVSGLGGYLPLFSLSGVVAFFHAKQGRRREKVFILVMLLFAFIPMLNAAFSAFNSEYYARWYYMPILIMAVMTGRMIEERADNRGAMQIGVIFVGVATLAIIAMSIFPAKDGNGEMTVLGKLKNPEQLVCEIVFSTVMFLLLVLYHIKISKCSDMIVRIMVEAACLFTCAVMLTTGELLIEKDRKDPFVDQVLTGYSPLPKNEGFYRVETDEDMYNYPMIWGGHSITSFISTIADSTLDFYAMNEIPRKVTSNPYYTRVGFRTLLSGKYYIKDDKTPIETIGRLEKIEDLPGYKEAYHSANGFAFYLNTNYIPMGFSFNEYLLRRNFEDSELTKQQKDKNLVNALIIEAEDEEELSKYMAPLGEMRVLAGNEFVEACKQRRESACRDFTVSTKGFKATADMAKDNLVFFSVPYEKGFTAYVDGTETKIYKVDAGFMGVVVPMGSHSIEFKYVPTGLKEGAILSAIGLLLLLLNFLLPYRKAYATIT
ncbi:MAG: YfhO family protein [Lachnospiraceae bacterium]|nr:YfhO family protein [Lachnospiraceae bacterium]